MESRYTEKAGKIVSLEERLRMEMEDRAVAEGKLDEATTEIHILQDDLAAETEAKITLEEDLASTSSRMLRAWACPWKMWTGWTESAFQSSIVPSISPSKKELQLMVARQQMGLAVLYVCRSDPSSNTKRCISFL